MHRLEQSVHIASLRVYICCKSTNQNYMHIGNLLGWKKYDSVGIKIPYKLI